MIVVELTYKVSLEELDKHLVTHREFLDEGYAKGLLYCSGPKDPRVGGFLLSASDDVAALEAFVKDDPFYIHDLADYKITRFDPVKAAPAFKANFL